VAATRDVEKISKVVKPAQSGLKSNFKRSSERSNDDSAEGGPINLGPLQVHGLPLFHNAL
jgi:hypothetical protein